MASQRTHIKKRQAQRRSRQMATLLISLGLIIVGVAVILIWWDVPTFSTKDSGTESASDLPPISSVIPMKVDFPAPELALTALQGGAQTLEDYRGEVVLVNNWAIWCPPCKAELPHMEAFYQRHKNEGFTIIGIEAASPKNDVAAYIDDTKLTFPIWLDPRNEALAAFRNQSLPSSYVVDREGQIKLAWTGAISLDMLEKYVSPLITD